MAAFLVFILALTARANADPSDDAAAAYRRGDYDGTVRILRTAAEGNDPKAQFALGRMLATGAWPHIKRDVAEGTRWLRAAASNDVVVAQMVLAEAYKYGRTVPNGQQDFPPNLAEALRWYQRAAENGNAQAQHEIGKAYWYGEGRPRDPLAAIGWFRMAAEGGHSDAQLTLGVQLAEGDVIPRDYVESRRWFLKLVSEPVEYANIPREYLGTFSEKGLGVPQDYAEAIRWYEDAARSYSPYAEYSLGVLYEEGRSTVVDAGKAWSYYRAAAFKRFAPAQYRLGIAYLNGQGVRVDSAEALEWLAFAIRQDPAEEPNAALRAPVNAIFERDPDLFHLRTGQLRPAAYDYALATAHRLAKDAAVLAKARTLAAAFQPTPPPPPPIP